MPFLVLVASKIPLRYSLVILFQMRIASKPVAGISASDNITEFTPCYNFALVAPGIYRSAHPTTKNFRFLEALQLRTICCLSPEPYADDLSRFCIENEIRVHTFKLEENREPFAEVRRDVVDQVMRVVVDVRNHPTLIHCERGRHRTGVICGCLRKLQGWSHTAVCSDYCLYNDGKGRLSDMRFLDIYDPIVCVTLPFIPSWLQRIVAESGATEILVDDSMKVVHAGAPQEVRTRRALAGGHVTLLLCSSGAVNGVTGVTNLDSEPMVMAVCPQDTHFLSQKKEKAPGDEKERKDKSDKREKKDKKKDIAVASAVET